MRNRERMLEILQIYKDMDEAEGESGVRDLLTDILHYCSGEEYNFEEILENAREVYEQEREELNNVVVRGED